MRPAIGVSLLCPSQSGTDGSSRRSRVPNKFELRMDSVYACVLFFARWTHTAGVAAKMEGEKVLRLRRTHAVASKR